MAIPLFGPCRLFFMREMRKGLQNPLTPVF